MKFSHSFAEELQSSNYPSEWRDAAIRYRQLKKCIKKVQKELVELGLNTDMLKSLAEQKDAVCAIQTPRLGYTPPTTSSSCMPADSSHLVYASVSLQQHSNDSDSIASSDRDTGDFDNQGLQNGDPQCAPNDVAGWEEESCGKLVTFSYCFDGLLLYYSGATFRLIRYPLLPSPSVCSYTRSYWPHISIIRVDMKY